MKVLNVSDNSVSEIADEITDNSENLTDNATREFFETLSSSETNSIAKIRAAAQKYLDDTKGGE